MSFYDTNGLDDITNLDLVTELFKASLKHQLPTVLFLPAETPATLGQQKFKVDLKRAKEAPVNIRVLANSCLAVYLACNFFSHTLSKGLGSQVFASHLFSSNIGTIILEALHSVESSGQPVIDSIVIDNENQTRKDSFKRAEQSANISQIVQDGVRDPAISVVILIVNENDTRRSAVKPVSVRARGQLKVFGVFDHESF